MKNPKITVLMPVYNGEEYLREAMDSILSQTFSDFEFLIIDGGSTDKSMNIIKSYSDSRINLVSHRDKKELIATLNEGIRLSKGEYIARMDADDISMPQRLEKQIDFMDSHSDVAVCGTWAKSIDKNGVVLSLMKAPCGILLKYNYWKPSPLIHPSVMIRTIFVKNLLFNEDAINAEDYDLWLRMIKKYRICNIKNFLLLYRIHSDNTSMKNRDNQLLSSYKSFLKNMSVRCITFNEFMAISSIDYKTNPWNRLKIILRIKKAINYPFAFMVLDSIAYLYKWIVTKLNEER